MSNLPQISTLNTSQDVKKQLAQIRSYLTQFKDETEAELNNVSYDMLSASLRKKLDQISEDVTVNSSNTELIAQTLSANYITADAINAQYATIGALTAEAARVNTLLADYATIATLNAQIANVTSLFANYATVGQLSAVSARVGVVEANYVDAAWVNANFITAAAVKADYMEVANWVSAGYIRADKISAETVTSKLNLVNSIVLSNNFGIAATGNFAFKNYDVEWGKVNGVWCLVRGED